jgi:hypothetical protein
VKSKLSVLSKLTIFKEEVGLSYALKVGSAYALSTNVKAAVESESDIMSPTKEQERNAMKRPRASKGGFIYAKRVRNQGPPFE